jgi:hypothetical protein
MGPLHSGGSILVSPLREAGGMPSSAIDPASGRIYAVWEDARFSKGKRADVVISVSSDGGRRWGAPRLVNPTDSMREFDPQIAVNADGMVGVTYYAMRNLKGANQPLPTRYVFQSSSDHGAHFGKSRALFGPFDMRLMPRVGGYFVGDYVGLTAVGKQFVSLFVTPAADDAPGKTSIVSVRVSP